LGDARKDAAADPAAKDDPSGSAAHLPGGDLIARDFDAFLDKFKRETGQR